jgi:hypothetical protein
MYLKDRLFFQHVESIYYHPDLVKMHKISLLSSTKVIENPSIFPKNFKDVNKLLSIRKVRSCFYH